MKHLAIKVTNKYESEAVIIECGDYFGENEIDNCGEWYSTPELAAKRFLELNK